MNEPCGLGWYALVADDDEDWRTLVSLNLRRAGFQVCEACDGEELVHRFASLSALMGDHIIVVSDISMPGRDGISATKWVRNASIDVPIVLVTAEQAPHVLAAARAAGATLIVSKPIGCRALVRAVSDLCA